MIDNRKKEAVEHLEEASKLLGSRGEEYHESAPMDYHHILDIMIDRIKQEVEG